MAVDENGRVVELGGVRYLNAADQVLEEMLTGWRRQQLSRNLGLATINDRERILRRFLNTTNEMPWHWTPAHVDEYFGDLRAIKHLKTKHDPRLPECAAVVLCLSGRPRLRLGCTV